MIKRNNKKKLCLIIDVYDWAFHNIAKEIQKRYYSDIITYELFEKKIKHGNLQYDNYDIYIYFYIKYNDVTKKKIKNYSYKKKMYYFQYENYTWKISKKRLISTKQKYTLIDKFFCASPNIFNDTKKNFKNITNFGSCYDGVDEKVFKFVGYKKDYKEKEKLVIGWIGNSNIKINGRIKRFIELNDVLNEKDMKERFVFKPLDSFNKKIPHNQVPNYIENIDIIVCFSKSEGTPNQILEASSCGKCWVSTDVGIVSLLQNTLPNNLCGLILEKSDDIEEEKQNLKNKLNYLYENRDLMVKYGENGRKAILKKFKIDTTIKNILSQI